MRGAKQFQPEYNDSEEIFDGLPDIGYTQDISGRNINAAKLMTMLRKKFGAGAYDVHVMHNSYCIMAPRKLSVVSYTENWSSIYH
jgi:hypothetical protein